MRTPLAILLLLPLAFGVPTGEVASASTTMPAGCGCQQEPMPSCAGACCPDDAAKAHDRAGICDCGTTDDASHVPAVPTATGTDKPIRDVAHERAPRLAATPDAATRAAARTPAPEPPPPSDPAPADLGVWRN